MGTTSHEWNSRRSGDRPLEPARVIGRLTALRFAEESASVAVIDIVEDGGKKIIEMTLRLPRVLRTDYWQ